MPEPSDAIRIRGARQHNLKNVSLELPRGKLSPPSDGHAGLLETSRVMALAPETVGSERPSVPYRHSPFVPGAPKAEDWPESVMGDTRPASAELGRKVQDHVLDRLTATVRELLPA